jgi:DNA-binding NarL/FixJ family response regulator
MKHNQETYLKLVVEMAAKAATDRAIEIHKQLHLEDERLARDKRLRNTKLLLKNYREFKAYVQKIERKVTKNEGVTESTNITDLLVYGEDIVKTIKVSTQRTILMVQYIDQSLAAFKYICENDPYRDSIRQSDVLYLRFVEGKTIEDIAEEFRINERSVYKAIDSASERLSVILFGVYGIKIS